MHAPRIRALIVDDEPLAREGLREIVARDPEVEVVGECADGLDAVEALRALRPDLVLLDVRMPELDGFGVIRAVGAERMPVVVFVTAFDDFAVRAFDVSAVDYVTKPFEDARLLAAVARAKRAVRSRDVDALAARLARVLEAASGDDGDVTRLVIRDRGRTTFVALRDIDWIEGADYYARVHAGERSHLLRETLASLEARLDDSEFFRVHRSAIVRLDRVREIRASGGDQVVAVLASGVRVPIGRGRREELERRVARLAG